MATPPTDPENITSEELLDGMIEHHDALIDVQQAYEQQLQQTDEDIKSLLRELQEKMEEKENIREKSKATSTLEYYKNEEARLREKGKEYKERLYQRLQGDDAEALRNKLVSLGEKNNRLQKELEGHRQLVSKSMKDKFAMNTTKKEKDLEIKMLTDELKELRQQFDLLQDLHMNMEEEPDSEATQSDDQHTEKGICYICIA